MPPTAAPAPPLPSFGKLGSVAAPVPVPAGAVRLTRTLGDSVEYVAPPDAVGQGLRRLKWERNLMAGPGVYTLTADGDDLAAAVPLAAWRAKVAADFPPGPVNRKSAGAVRLAEVARALLTTTAALHAARWRLGLTGPDNLYVVERPATQTDPKRTDVFLPDLGAAWVGAVALAKPNWLKAEPADADLWAEDRSTRQYAAPIHYQKYLTSTDWAELVRRDVRLAGRLLRYVLTGDVSAPEPPGTARCPVWEVLRKADAGKYADTDDGSAAANFLKEFLEALRQPVDPTPPPPPPGSVWPKMVAAAVLLAAAGGGGWYLWTQSHKPPIEVVDNKTSPNPPDGDLKQKGDGAKQKDGGTPPKLPPSGLQGAEEKVKTASNLVDRGKAAVELAKLDPTNTLVAETRNALLDEIKKNYAIARSGGHVPLTTRALWDLYKQLPEAPTPNPEPRP